MPPTGRGTRPIVIGVRTEPATEDLPNTTNPDDWAKISGKKGERIVFIRTLISEETDEGPMGGRTIERTQTGQYL